MNVPNPPQPTSALMAWLKRLYHAVLANHILPGSGYRVHRTPRGTILQIVPGVGAGSGGWNYRSDYDPSKGYGKDDVVRVRTGSSQGVYICVKNNPVDLNSGTSAAPIYPEPASLNPPGENIWEVLSLGVVEQSSCVSSEGKTIYVNASQPF
jgi:hypothetical protein